MIQGAEATTQRQVPARTARNAQAVDDDLPTALPTHEVQQQAIQEDVPALQRARQRRPLAARLRRSSTTRDARRGVPPARHSAADNTPRDDHRTARQTTTIASKRQATHEGSDPRRRVRTGRARPGRRVTPHEVTPHAHHTPGAQRAHATLAQQMTHPG